MLIQHYMHYAHVLENSFEKTAKYAFHTESGAFVNNCVSENQSVAESGADR
jgi:hypothetical protein